MTSKSNIGEQSNVLNNNHVLSDELHEIEGTTEGIISDEKILNKKMHDCYPRTAICLSGGGIRSATFALGAIQALARNKLLSHFKYLSTVSGGGYTGAWLTAWLARSESSETVLSNLNCSEDHEAYELKYLRQNSLYLTPRTGLDFRRYVGNYNYIY